MYTSNIHSVEIFGLNSALGCCSHCELILSGVELIFFTLSDKGLCFGVVLQALLMTQGRFHYC